jgi:hypothetical protein
LVAPTSPTSPPFETLGQAAAGPIGSIGRFAGFWQRLGAHLIDTLLYGLLLAPFAMAMALSAVRANDECFSLGSEVVEVICPPDAPAAGPRVAAFGFGRALWRQLFAFTISWVALLFGYLWMLWDGERQTWHDKVADTVVVEC